MIDYPRCPRCLHLTWQCFCPTEEDTMPANVTEVIIYDLRHCDLCLLEDASQAPAPAEYDAKTKAGPWANLCEGHYETERAYDTLGTGKGQRLRFIDRRACYECDSDRTPLREVEKEITVDRRDPTAAYILSCGHTVIDI